MLRPFTLACALTLLLAPAAQARESLGLYATWGEFRDPLIPRCYAIAMAEPSSAMRTYQPFAAIGTWPRRGARNQVHFRLSRKVAQNAPIMLTIGDLRTVRLPSGEKEWEVIAIEYPSG